MPWSESDRPRFPKLNHPILFGDPSSMPRLQPGLLAWFLSRVSPETILPLAIGMELHPVYQKGKL